MEAASNESTISGLLTEAAARGRGGYFFHLGEDPVALPVAELYERALTRAAQLGHEGVQKGEMVGLLGPNSPAWAEWAWGTWLAGCVLVPLPAPVRVRDPGAFSSQVASLAQATCCSTIVGDKGYLDFLDDGLCPRLDWARVGPLAVGQRPAQVSPSDLAIVLCTSGSTAAPKGVRMSHARALVWVRVQRRQGSLGRCAGDRFLVALLPHRWAGAFVRTRHTGRLAHPADGTLRERSRGVAPAGWQDARLFHLRPVLGLGGGLAGLGEAARGRRSVLPGGGDFQCGDRRPRCGGADRRSVRALRHAPAVGERALCLLGRRHDQPHGAL